MNRPHWLVVLGMVLAIVGSGIALTVSVTDDNGKTTVKEYKFQVNEAANSADNEPTKTLTVPQPVILQTAGVLERELLLPPPGVTQQQLDDAAAAERRISLNKQPLPTAGATAGIPGCVSKFVRNQSSRRGVRPSQYWLHYTVSPNRPGWSDVNAIVGLFDRSSFQASSNFVIDAEGHCAYIVPIEAKAWTQAAANPFAISFEVINTGSESAYLQTPGYDKLRSVLRELRTRTGIPLRRGSFVQCHPTSSGIVQHKDGGICSGGHHDISPFSVPQVISIVSAPIVKPVSTHARQQCNELNSYRRDINNGAKLPASKMKRFYALRRSLKKHHYSCWLSKTGQSRIVKH